MTKNGKKKKIPHDIISTITLTNPNCSRAKTALSNIVSSIKKEGIKNDPKKKEKKGRGRRGAITLEEEAGKG